MDMRSVNGVISPKNDRNYFQAMVDVMVKFLKTVKKGESVTYERLISAIDAESKDYAVRVYRVASRRIEITDGIFFRTRHNEGYERVSASDSVDVCKKQITFGLRKVKRGVERTHSIDMKELTDNQKAEVIQIQSSIGRLQIALGE